MKLKNIMLNNKFKQDLFSFFPKYLIFELFILSAFVFYFVFTYIELKDLNVVIPKIIFLIMAAFRVLPGINKIIINSQVLRTNSATIVNIYNEKLQSKKIKFFNKDKAFTFKNELNLQKVNLEYSSGKTILENINIRIQKGDILGIYGASGSGKTTLINLFLGLLKPTSGSILIDNKYDLFENSSTWHKFISFVPQKIFMKNDSITNNIAFAVESDFIDEKKVNFLIKLCNLNNFVENKRKADQIFVGDDANKISGGQAQRIGIARGLYKNPEVLILDEATNNLDEQNEQEILLKIKDLFKKEKKTAIIVSHNHEILKLNCDYIFKLTNGKIENIK